MGSVSRLSKAKKPVSNLGATAGALAVAHAFPNRPKNAPGSYKNTVVQTWAAMDDISKAHAESILLMANSINETVEMVKLLGCDHPAEFNVMIQKTNTDMLKFSDDFQKVRARHQGRTGIVETPDDLALYLSIFEDYNQFRAYFDGVMNHTLVSCTEYALEAKDRALDRMKAEEAAAAANPSTPPVTDTVPVSSTPDTQ